MPTTYAHWRFGNECLKTLPDNLQSIIKEYRDVFDYGVHGPDIFFYYKCYKKNDVNMFGSAMHEIPFGKTLKDFKLKYKDVDNKNACLAYMLGFTCHFLLDSYCHGFIDLKAEVSPVSHGKIESQFDRYLLKKDGYNPVKKSVTTSLKPSKKVAHAISQLIDKYNEETIFKVIKDQKFYLNILKDSNRLKRSMLIFLFEKVGPQSYKDLLLTEVDEKECITTNMRLQKYFDKAIEHYPILANSLVSYLENNTKLDSYFKNHFAPKTNYKSIPILSLRAEEKYEVELQD